MADSITDDVLRFAPSVPTSDSQAAIMARILTCASFDDLPKSVIIPVGQAIDACSGVFMQFLGLPMDGDTVGRSIGADDNIRRASDAYVDGLYTVDPMVKPALDWLRVGDAVPDRTVGLLTEVPGWRDEVPYRRFLERYRIGDVLTVAVSMTTAFGPEVMCLGFHRNSHQDPFTERERGRVQALLPALQAVLRNLAHSDALGFSGQLIRELGDVGDGLNLLVLDQDLRIRHANHRALRQLAVQRAGSDVQIDILGALRKRLMDAPPLVGERLRIDLSNCSGRPADLRPIQVEVATFQAADSRIYYLVTESGAAIRPDTAKRRSLTDRECEVVDLVCLGHNSSIVARQLGITRRTVENHLRSVYAKFGVNSRTQLAAHWLRDEPTPARTGPRPALR
jgi:DNA-binding CsgD family transcriptional regulator